MVLVCGRDAGPHAGLEALKSLVLAGVGRFTIVDESRPATRDEQTRDFLLAGDDGGLRRAPLATQRLLELVCAIPRVVLRAH